MPTNHSVGGNWHNGDEVNCLQCNPELAEAKIKTQERIAKDEKAAVKPIKPLKVEKAAAPAPKKTKKKAVK